ncbi:unnamed protein product [Orchesella dallaii]|uniref:C2H2-type domain-containing protein n=1 Tax=Orchesella dallaii TaxID=48710 RepID=A0ABP1QC59_9HEXA
MAGSQSCVFCLRGLQPILKRKIKSEVLGGKVDNPGDEEEEDISPLSTVNQVLEGVGGGGRRGASCKLLETEMKVIFIVRKLLRFTEHKCEELLQTFGNPSSWLTVCNDCAEMVNEALVVYDKIAHLEMELGALKAEAEKRIGDSNRSHYRKSRSNVEEAAAAIRSFVLNVPLPVKLKHDSPATTGMNQIDMDIEIKLETDVYSNDGRNENDFDDNNLFDDMNADSDPDFVPGDDQSDFEYEKPTPNEYTGGAIDKNSVTPKKRKISNKSSPNKRRKKDTPLSETALQQDENLQSDVPVFKCNWCSYTFNWKSDFLRHIREIHNEITPEMKTKEENNCKLCGIEFQTQNELINHKIEEHNMMKCPHCPNVFSILAKLNAHLRRYHREGESQEDKKTVSHTNAIVIGETEASQIEKNHKNEVASEADEAENDDDDFGSSYKCPRCNFRNSSRYNIVRHLRNVHGEYIRNSKILKKDKKCMKCDQIFKNTLTLKTHCVDEHKMTCCRYCSRLFSKLSWLQAHEKRHELKAPSASKMPRSNAERSELKPKTAENTEVHKCSRCTFVTNDKCVLNRHIREVHWENPADAKKSTKWKCTQCSKAFTDPDSFKSHCLHDHKMLSCDKCSKFFINESRLKSHKVRHHGEKKNSELELSQCPHCSFSTKRICNLNKHLREIHWEVTSGLKTKDQKRRKCNQCDRTFEDMEDFKKHCVNDHQMLKCKHCPILFPTLKRLRSHERRHHSNNHQLQRKFLQCPRCSYNCKTIMNFNRHVRDVHWDVSSAIKSKGLMKSRKCSQCQLSFRDLDKLWKHCREDHQMVQCRKCPKVFPTVPGLRMHENKSHGLIRSDNDVIDKYETIDVHQCPYCDFKTYTIGRYKVHVRLWHWELPEVQEKYPIKSKDLYCDKCSKNLGTIAELTQHKIDVHEMIKCGKCACMVIAIGYLERHEQAFHSGKPTGTTTNTPGTENANCSTNIPTSITRKIYKPSNKCSICQLTCSNREELATHRLENHPDKMFKCDKCSSIFDTLARLYSHKVEIHHEQKNPYKCPLCMYTNKHYSQIEKHKQRVHEEKSIVICEICSKTYQSEKTLLFHKIRDHGHKSDRNYTMECKICNKTFSTPWYLKNHVTTVHENNYRYRCPICEMGFRGKKQVATHVQVVHENIRNFKCTEDGCQREFGTNSARNNHIRKAHKREKRFQCLHCEAAFSDGNHLRRHEQIHTNKETRPFQCHHCGKGFPVLSYLRQHLKSHVRKGDEDLTSTFEEK